jgi:hypothetical protein
VVVVDAYSKLVGLAALVVAAGTTRKLAALALPIKAIREANHDPILFRVLVVVVVAQVWLGVTGMRAAEAETVLRRLSRGLQ